MAPTRRSTRARRPVQDIYADSLKAKETDDDHSRKKQRVKPAEESSDSEPPPEDENIEQDSSEEESASEDESVHEKPTKRAVARQIRPIRVHGESKGKRKAPQAKRAPAANSRSIQSSFKAAQKKVLHKEETPENSLLAAVLSAAATGGAASKSGSRYTAALTKIAEKFLADHDQDPNKAHVDLFNLLFRSVGGSRDTMLSADKLQLDNVTDDEWEEIITQITESMQVAPKDALLLCADPHGPANVDGSRAKPSVLIREFRALYKEFWHTLGVVALTHDVSPDANSSDDEEDEEDVPQGTSRFQIQTTSDILSRMMEMIGVGQPDIRAAAAIAVYQLSLAMLERTVELLGKQAVAARQLAAAKRSKSEVKAKALKHQLDSWKRAIGDLEEIVEGTVMKGVFTRRYCDSNMFIRAESLNSISQFMLLRPDKFLTGTYLKYFGWMLSDKEAIVRISAIDGLAAPYREAEAQDGKRGPLAIDTKSMEKVIEKFLNRLTDCVADVDFNMQERAISFLLVLVRSNLLDSVYDETVWSDINVRALDPNTTPSVRRDALYIVIEQLTPFDEGDATTDNKAFERLDALANWAGFVLASGNIPIDDVHYEYSDYLIHSLLSMSEHKGLVSKWGAMIRALKCDDSLQSATASAHDLRTMKVKQRIVLQMIACSAEVLLGTKHGDDFLVANSLDPDVLAARRANQLSLEPTKKKQKANESAHEQYTAAFVGSLPQLMEFFKGDTPILQGLTRLPHYFLPSVLSLPNRKSDFMKVLGCLSDLLLEETDSTVLNNCCMSLTALAKENHARKGEALMRLKKLACLLRDRLMGLLHETANSPATNDDAPDTQNAICLALRRLKVLSKRWDISDLLAGDASDDDAAIVDLYTSIVGYLGKELTDRLVRDDDDSSKPKIPFIWLDTDPELHRNVAASVVEGLPFLIVNIGWRLQELLTKVDPTNGTNPSTPDIEELSVPRMRELLVKLLSLCCDMKLCLEEASESDRTSPTINAFADEVQSAAFAAMGDLRSLLPKRLEVAKSPVLRACALTDQNLSKLLGCQLTIVRKIASRLYDNHRSEEDAGVARTILMPQMRPLVSEWQTNGNRREAGILARFLTDHGEEAHDIVLTMSRMTKKLDGVRLLESHFMGLGQEFTDWLQNQPEEPVDVHPPPSDEEMNAYEELVRLSEEKLHALEQWASRLSSTLGVGKLDSVLAKAMPTFVKKGVIFAFSFDEGDLPGGRLPFLRLLAKYLTWIRRDEVAIDELSEALNKCETVLRTGDDYDELNELELKSVRLFREAGGLGDYVEPRRRGRMAPTGTSVKSGASGISTAASGRSSVDSDDDGPESSASPTISRKFGTQGSPSTMGRTEDKHDDASSADEDDKEDQGTVSKASVASRSRRSVAASDVAVSQDSHDTGSSVTSPANSPAATADVRTVATSAAGDFSDEESE